MSPDVRSLLADAADDQGRPVTIDLVQVRSAGRRAVRRRRLIAGSGALATVALVGSVAVVVAPVAETSGVAGSPGSVPLNPPNPTATGPQPWVTSPLLDPLLEAIGAEGLTAERVGTGTSGIAVLEAPEDGGSGQTLTSAAFRLTQGGGEGALVVAEFTDPSALLGSSHFVAYPAEPQLVEQCAILPVSLPHAGFVWGQCDKQTSAPGELWRVTGADPYGDGLGVTFVRPDGSGLSIALGTAEYDRPRGQAGRPESPLLTELPLTESELVEFVTTIAARGRVFYGVESPGVATPVETFTTTEPR